MIRSKLERGQWKVAATTSTRIWSEKTRAGEAILRYEAEAQAFIGEAPFEKRRVEGTIPYHWI